MKINDKTTKKLFKYSNENMAYLCLYEALDRNDSSLAFSYAYYLVDFFVDKERTSFTEWFTKEKAEQILNMTKEPRAGKTDSVSSTIWKLVETVRELRENEI